MRDDIVLLVSRLLLAWIFLHEGAFLLVNYSASSAGMAKMGVPAFAPPLVIALQLIAGAAIAVGWYARCGAAALGLFCLATAFLFHTNFAVRNELLHFEKDLAIAGGMFVLMVCGAGRWSVDVRCGRSMGSLTGRSEADCGRLDACFEGGADCIQLASGQRTRAILGARVASLRLCISHWLLFRRAG